MSWTHMLLREEAKFIVGKRHEDGTRSLSVEDGRGASVCLSMTDEQQRQLAETILSHLDGALAVVATKAEAA